MQEPSLFTKIINGDVPSHKVYEDEFTYAFLDIYPTQPGHTLVIPKSQVEFVWDLTDEDYQSLMMTTKKVAQRLRDVLPATYVGVKVIGTDVPHSHVHLIPFNEGSEFYEQREMSGEPDHEALAAIAAKIRFS